MASTRILLIGASRAHDVQTVKRQLEEWTSCQPSSERPCVVCEASVAAALHRFSKQVRFDLVLLVPSVRNQFGSVAIERLRQRFVGVEHWTIVGSWLEGETRSGHPFPSERRIYLHQFRAKLRLGWLRQLDGSTPPMTDDERKVFGDTTCRPADTELATTPTGLVVVVAELAAQRAFLCEMVAAMGASAVAFAPGTGVALTGVDAVILDGLGEESRTIAELTELRRTAPLAPCVVLISFPRPDETERLLAAGATHVVGKPFVNADLATHLSPDKTVSPSCNRATYPDRAA